MNIENRQPILKPHIDTEHAEPTDEALRVDGAMETVAMLGDMVEQENPGMDPNAISAQVDHEIAGLVWSGNSDPNPDNQITADLVGIAEELSGAGGETSNALNASPPDALEGAFVIARNGGIPEDDLARVVREIDSTHGSGIYEDHRAAVNAQAEALRDRRGLTGQVEYITTPETEVSEVLAAFDGMQQRDIDSLYAAKDPGVLLALSEISKSAVDPNDAFAFSRHKKAVRALKSTRPNAYGWKNDVVKMGKLIPEATRNYVENKGMPVVEMGVAFDDALAAVIVIDNDPDIPTEQKNSMMAEVKEKLNYSARQAIGTALETGTADPAIRDNRIAIAEQYMQGDVREFGNFTDIPDASKFYRMQGSMLNYIANATEIGPQGIETLHNQLGLVNFDRYNKEQLKFGLAVAEGKEPTAENAPDRQLSVLVSGRDGDHNSAFGPTIRRAKTQRTLPFEISNQSGLAKVNHFLDTHNLGVNHLTFAGHGGEQGVHISKKMIMGHGDYMDAAGVRHISPAQDPELRALLGRLEVNNITGSREVVLMSCSQAKRRYMPDGTPLPSMAERIAQSFPDMRVIAPDKDAYIMATGEQGGIKMRADGPLAMELKDVNLPPKRRAEIEEFLRTATLDMRFVPTAISVGGGSHESQTRGYIPDNLAKIGD